MKITHLNRAESRLTVCTGDKKCTKWELPSARRDLPGRWVFLVWVLAFTSVETMSVPQL